MRRSLLLVVLGAVVSMQAVAAVAAAVTVTESGDAGSLPSTAQVISGSVDVITGNISTGSDEDVYAICLEGGRTFSATTQGSQLLDPQLFLFDASGRGVYGNDDFFGLQSNLPAGDPLTPTEGGTYYLAISSFRNVPVSQGGEIFRQLSPFFPVQPPTGPGGSSPVSDWNGSGALLPGSYRITMTGTVPCLPTTTEECKNGGWRDFGVFKNQGDCVSFVATGGKNPPVGP
jgi:hypothetical protein